MAKSVTTSKNEFDERLMELRSLFEISKTLNAKFKLKSILSNILLTPMGRMMITKGAVLLKDDDTYRLREIKGLPQELKDSKVENVPLITSPMNISTDKYENDEYAKLLKDWKIKLSIPINAGDKLLGMLLFGNKLTGEEYNDNELDFLNSLSNIAASAISNSMLFAQISDVNRKLDRSNQSLNTLFDIGNELNSTFDESKILKLLGYALMGQLFINKYAIFLKNEDTFELKECKGLGLLEDCIKENGSRFNTLPSIDSAHRVSPESDSELDQCMRENGIKLLIPMKVREETKGIICFSDRITKTEFLEEDIEFLLTLGNSAMISLENARLFDVTLEKKKMEEELAVARDIQDKLLPKNFPLVEGVGLSAENVASKFVGGDYYDFIKVDDDTLAVVIADVSGKGVPASLLMSNLQASIRSLVDLIDDTALLTAKINRIIYDNTTSDKFITFFIGRYNIKKKEFQYCNAGHNHPFIMAENGDMRFLEDGGLILGMMDNVKYEKGLAKLSTGDSIVLYTDGISEAMNHKEEEYEEYRLYDICKKHSQSTAEELKMGILNSVKEFCAGFPQSDDITLVTMKIK